MRTINANSVETPAVFSEEENIEQVAVIATDDDLLEDEDRDVGTAAEVIAILTSEPEVEALDPDDYGHIEPLDPVDTDEEYEKAYPIWVADHALDGEGSDVTTNNDPGVVEAVDDKYEALVAETKTMYDEGCITEGEMKAKLVYYAMTFDKPVSEELLAEVSDDIEKRLEEEQMAKEAVDEEMILHHTPGQLDVSQFIMSPGTEGSLRFLGELEQVKDSTTGVQPEMFNDLGNNPVMQAEMDALAEQHDTAVEREELLKEIHEFYDLLDMPVMGVSFSRMDNIGLSDHLDMLRKNNGGSFTMAKLLVETEIEYDRLLKSDAVTMRLKLVEQQSSDVIKLMQKMRDIVGNDFVISGVRSGDYYNMLRSAVTYISTVHDKVSMLGQQLGLRLPTEDFARNKKDSIPIIEGMPADPRVAIYVLNTLTAYIDKFTNQLDIMNKQVDRSKLEVVGHKSREEYLSKAVEQANTYSQMLTAEADRLRSNSAYWVIRDDKGQFLRAIDPDEPVTHSKHLDLKGDYYTALQFTSKSAAREWSERIMATKRFRGRVLKPSRVSIVEDL